MARLPVRPEDAGSMAAPRGSGAKGRGEGEEEGAGAMKGVGRIIRNVIPPVVLKQRQLI